MQAGSKESLSPMGGAERSARRKLALRHEILLLLLPTAIVLAVLGALEALAEDRILFGSLAASAFLIYLDPEHGTNTVRTLIFAHVLASVFGAGVFVFLGPGYTAAAIAMMLTVLSMLLLDVVHPPAIATSLTFAFRSDTDEIIPLFALALGMLVILVLLERAMLHLLTRLRKH